MLLKRSLILAAGVLLFIVVFIAYFQISHAQMEKRFQAEREKFGVQGVVLTASPTSTPAPAAAAPPDTNTLIGPVPSASSPTTDSAETPAAPETNSAPASSAAPAAPDSNAAPAMPAAPSPASTMDYPRASRSPFFQLASFRPTDGAEIRMAGALLGAATASSAPTAASPATNGSPIPAATSVPVITPAVSPPPPTAPVATNTNSMTAPRPAVPEGSVIVLLFHQFKAPGVPIPKKFQWTMNQDVFESEMKYIHDNDYHVIPIAQLLKFLKHEDTVPPRAVCITIDDGYKSAIVYAAPILKKYGYPWTFFIYPDFITTGEGPGAASWNDLLQLQAEGIDIESHSMTHPNLKLHKQKIKGVWHDFTPEEYEQWLTNETAGAKALLEQKMGKPITCFAYPYGEYNTQVEAAVIAAGYEAIFTVADNPVHATTSLDSIGRYTITQGVEKNFAAYLRQGALRLATIDPAPGTTISNPRPVITAVLTPSGASTIDPASIETSVRDFGPVRHDFDPQTNTLRLYLPYDLIQQVELVNIRARDATTGQVMVANWHFNYEPGGDAAPTHVPIGPMANPPPPQSPPPDRAATNAPGASAPEPLEKSAIGTPLDAHQITPAPPPAPAPATTTPATPPRTD